MFKRLLVIIRRNPWGGKWQEEKCRCKPNSTSTQPQLNLPQHQLRQIDHPWGWWSLWLLSTSTTSSNWSSAIMIMVIIAFTPPNTYFVKLISFDHDHDDPFYFSTPTLSNWSSLLEDDDVRFYFFQNLIDQLDQLKMKMITFTFIDTSLSGCVATLWGQGWGKKEVTRSLMKHGNTFIIVGYDRSSEGYQW